MKENRTPRPLWISMVSIMLAFLLAVSALGGPQIIGTAFGKYASTVSVGGITLSIDAAPAILTTGTKLNELFKANSSDVTSVTFGPKSQYASYCTGTGIDVSSTGDGSLKLYRSGSNIYIVSENDRTIASNPDFSNAFSGLTSLKTVKFPDNFDTSRTTSFAYFCYGASALESINVDMFDTSNATTMQSMFYLSYNSSVNQKLSVLDVSGFDTSKVTDMGSIFRGCGNITSFDLSNFDTSNVKDMGGMFDGCDSLTSVNVSSFDTSKATTMQVMFNGCTSLKTLDLSSFTCESLTDMRSMFAGCSNLKTIYADYEFDCRNVASSGGAFTGCSSLVGGYGTSYNANAASTDAEVKANAATGAYAVIDLKLAVEQDVLQSTQGYFTHSSISGAADTAIMTTGTDFNAKFKSLAGSTTITKIVFGKLSDYGFTGGTNIDASNSGTIKMYKQGSTIYVLSDAKICFNPASDYMFQNLSTVTSISFSNIDTGAVRTMQRFFEGCTALTGLDLSLFNTSNVLDFGGFLRYCDALTSADAKAIANAIDTSKARDIGGFFADCNGLTGAVDLSGLSSAKAETMASLISACPNITSVNLSGLTRSSSLYNASDMFDGCTSLTRIYTNSSFNLTGLPTTSPATGSNINASLFSSCTNLVGTSSGHSTAYSANNTPDMNWARADSSTTPGYFTAVNMPASLSLFAVAPMMLVNPDAEPVLQAAVSDSDAGTVSGSDVPVAGTSTVASGSDLSDAVVSGSDVTTSTTTTATTTTTAATTTVTTAASTSAAAAVTTTGSTAAASTTAASSDDNAATTSAAATTTASVAASGSTTETAETSATASEVTTTASSDTTTAAETTAATSAPTVSTSAESTSVATSGTETTTASTAASSTTTAVTAAATSAPSATAAPTTTAATTAATTVMTTTTAAATAAPTTTTTTTTVRVTTTTTTTTTAAPSTAAPTTTTAAPAAEV